MAKRPLCPALPPSPPSSQRGIRPLKLKASLLGRFVLQATRFRDALQLEEVLKLQEKRGVWCLKGGFWVGFGLVECGENKNWLSVALRLFDLGPVENREGGGTQFMAVSPWPGVPGLGLPALWVLVQGGFGGRNRIAWCLTQGLHRKARVYGLAGLEPATSARCHCVTALDLSRMPKQSKVLLVLGFSGVSQLNSCAVLATKRRIWLTRLYLF